MKVVYKYPMPGNTTTLKLPADHRVVHVDLQHSFPTMWIEHADPNAGVDLYECHFEIFGTGYEIPDSAVFCGTYFSGPFVWHIYEVEQ